MPARLGCLLPVLAALGVCVAAAPARAAAPDWAMAPLPGGRAGLPVRLGLSPDVPLALVVGEMARVVHGSRDPDNRALSIVKQFFAVPIPGPSEQVPIPLPLAAWRDLLGGEVTEDTWLASVLSDRRASLLCYGLLQLDRETLSAIARDAGLLRRLYGRRSGTFAAFAQAVRVRDGRLVLPGGDKAAEVWQALVGEPLTSPSAAIAALLDADDGRLIYFADAVAGLDAPQLAIVFRGRDADATPLDQARTVYRAFRRIESGWHLGDFPFVRLGADPALLLGMLRVDPATGRLRHTEAFWNTALDDDGLPDAVEKRWSALARGERADPGWLLERVTNAALPVRLERLLIYEFAERMTDRLPGASAGELAWLARAYRHYPALLLMLERLDVADLGVWKRMVANASRVTAAAGDAAAVEIGLGLYQAPLALLARGRQARAFDETTARALVASLSEISPPKSGYGRTLARWFDTALLPALGHDSTSEGASAEASVLEAAAGLRAPARATAPGIVTWESQPYRVDVAAPELARLTEVRGLQGGNTLDLALALCRAGAALGAVERLDQVRSATAALGALRDALAPVEVSERTTAPPPTDLSEIADHALTDLAKIRTRADLKRVGTIAARLSRAEDAALADVLTSLLYAIWLGDPQGQVFLAGNVARRHDYGVRLMTAEERTLTPWQLPIESSGDGEPWHLRGALLGLDFGLARLALRRTRLDLPDDQPTLNESDRLTLLATLVLTDATDSDAATAARVAAGLVAGRALARSPALLRSLDGLALDGRRRQAIEWAVERTPDQVVALLLRTELLLLGLPAGQHAPAAWGTADTPRSGCLCLRFPAPPSLHRFAGRAGSGLLASRMADLKLRVLEVLDSLRLPVTLARGVLASALQDYLDEARPVHGDDWFTLARQVDRVPAERFDDYIAALTAGGPLVPVAPPEAQQARAHP